MKLQRKRRSVLKGRRESVYFMLVVVATVTRKDLADLPLLAVITVAISHRIRSSKRTRRSVMYLIATFFGHDCHSINHVQFIGLDEQTHIGIYDPNLVNYIGSERIFDRLTIILNI